MTLPLNICIFNKNIHPFYDHLQIKTLFFFFCSMVGLKLQRPLQHHIPIKFPLSYFLNWSICLVVKPCPLGLAGRPGFNSWLCQTNDFKIKKKNSWINDFHGSKRGHKNRLYHSYWLFALRVQIFKTLPTYILYLIYPRILTCTHALHPRQCLPADGRGWGW